MDHALQALFHIVQPRNGIDGEVGIQEPCLGGHEHLLHIANGGAAGAGEANAAGDDEAQVDGGLDAA